MNRTVVHDFRALVTECDAHGFGGAKTMNFPRTGRIPISLTIATTFVGLVVVLLGSVLTVSYFSSLRNTLNLVGELVIQSSGFVKDELRDHLDSVIEQVDWTADLIATGPLDLADDQQVGNFLLGALAATPQVTALAYISTDKRVVRAYRGDPGEGWRLDTDPPRDLAFTERTLKTGRERDKGFWNEILFSEPSQRSYINYVQPVRRNGEFLGVVLAAVSLNELSELVSQISDRVRGTVFILAGEDQIIAHPNLTSGHPELSKETPTVGIGRVGDLVLEEFWSAETHPTRVTSDLGDLTLRQTEIRGQRYVFAHTQVEGYGESPWIVGHHLDTETAEAAFRQLRDTALVGLVILVLGIGLAIFLGRKVARPIKAASAGASHIAKLEISEVEELPRSPFAELDSQAQSFNAMLGALRWFQTYVPRSLVRRLISRGDQEIASEERSLTILFTDLVGFTSACEAMTARQTANLLNHHFALLAKCAESEEGTIDKFIGDALMAFWGAPDPQPDQADRAVRAVCAMAQTVQKDNVLRQDQGLAPIPMRIGLHSGPVVVGNIGAPERMNYTVVGDTVNTAQRMEGLGKEVAPEAEIVILASETVVAAMTLDVNHESVGAFTVKGRTEQVQVFRILP
jgi:class 3 adenylate cyclase